LVYLATDKNDAGKNDFVAAQWGIAAAGFY
jgi:hypothetical protein